MQDRLDDSVRLIEPENQVRYDLRAFDAKETQDEAGICGICLRPIREGNEAAFLPCMHAFHTDCIQKWIKVEDSCPICKSPLV